MAADIVLVSELFPPTVGGSAELLANIYARIPIATTVLTSNAGVDPRWPHLPHVATSFPSGQGAATPAALMALARVARAIRSEGAPTAIAHCARALPEGTAAWLNRRWGGQRYVCWTHGEELPVAAGSRELTWLMRRVHRHAARLVANSHNTARLLIALGNKPEHVAVVHPGVDASRFRPDADGAAELRRRLNPDNSLLIMSIGRLQARKGQDLVLRAAADARLAGRAIRYVVVGSGDEEQSLKQLAADLGIMSRVSFVGAVPTDELPAFFAAADIFVLPNRVEGQDFEGFGIVFLEAAASGVPVIGGDSGGVPEAVENGVTGLLVNGTDIGQLQQAIEQLAGSPDLRRRMGEAGRARALAQFSWQRAADQITQIDGEVRRGR